MARKAAAGRGAPESIAIRRAYAAPAGVDGYRVLVDRHWPRGCRREALNIAEWAQDIAPTAALLRWYGHDPARWSGFERRYRRELADLAQQQRLRALLEAAGGLRITLVYGSRDERHNQAVILREVLMQLFGG